MQITTPDTLGELLLRHRLVNQDALENAYQQQRREGGRLVQILLHHHLVQSDALAAFLSRVLEIPAVDLARMASFSPSEEWVPQSVAHHYGIVPLGVMGKTMTVAMSDPLNPYAAEDIQLATGLEVRTVVAAEDQIQNFLNRGKSQDPEQFQAALAEAVQSASGSEPAGLPKDAELSALHAAPIAKRINWILREALTARASDIFIEPTEEVLRVRMRVDGLLRPLGTYPLAMLPLFIGRLKVMGQLNLAEHRMPQDGRMKLEERGLENVDFRLSIVPSSRGEKAVIRVLDQRSIPLSLEQLGFEPEVLERLRKAAQRPNGLILACGPTGSGKTTTLYSLLRFLDNPGRNFVTVEDPVEYVMPGINQVAVNEPIGLTFARALRAILRQDPNVVLVGEIRDADTVDMVVKAALTGHLVLSTLHTNDTASSVTRLINMGVEPYLICATVGMVLSQRLVRRLCAHCRKPVQHSPQELGELVKSLGASQKSWTFYSVGGCKACHHSGYQGRIVLSEAMTMEPSIRRLVLDKAPASQVRRESIQLGMVSLRQDGLRKALKGMTSLEEVIRVSTNDQPEGAL